MILALAVVSPERGAADASGFTLTNYTDPAQAMGWGYRSHWSQPWRSYLDTVSAKTLLDAIGINFNVFSPEAAPTARLLRESGFTRARIEVGWGTLSYDDPSEMKEFERKHLETILTALHENGIRPLILLNANSNLPCPEKSSTIHLASPATAGDTQIHIDPSDLDSIVYGRTGITAEGISALQLFTSAEPDGTVTLSRPLLTNLPTGELRVTTLRYEPFRDAVFADGSPNPNVDDTMNGWLNYVAVVTREARKILGSDFDLEVWNELSFGSAFLNINNYYKPGIEWHGGYNQVQILENTVDYVRDPANDLGSVGIGSGFSNERPWDNGTQSPVGLTAIDKHPYAGWQSFPAGAQVNGNRPLNGLGEPSGMFDSAYRWHEIFTPTYDAFFPEYFLSGIQTETLVRDLAPYNSSIGGFDHGRHTHPPGGSPPVTWITEINMNPAGGPTPAADMSWQDIRHIESKDVLRTLAAYVNKGVKAVDFYAVKGGNLSLVEPSYFEALKNTGGEAPDRALGGETMDSVRRLTEAMAGTEQIERPRSISLDTLTDYAEQVQFEGNGTTAFPPLHDRDVFAFFPFQVNASRFVIPVYVMTRNVAKIYRTDFPPSDPRRFDLPPETYRMAIGGVDGRSVAVSALDPLTGEKVPVQVVSGSPDQVVVQMGVTDSPRLLTVQETDLESAPEPSPPATTSWVSPKSASERARARNKEVRFRVTGVRSLLRRRWLRVSSSCDSICGLRAQGNIWIRGRSFRMRPTNSAVAESNASHPTLKLRISARAARFGRRSLMHGAAVKAGLKMRAVMGSGGTRSGHRVIRLRR